MDKRNAEIASIEQEQRRLADRLAQLRKEPESVKPKVRMSYYDADVVTLEFDTKEQAEKAKAILEKMEFGEPPTEKGARLEKLEVGGSWSQYHWDDWPMDVAMWRMGVVRRK